MTRNTIDDDIVDLSDIMVENLDVPIQQQMKPIMDVLWQSSGWERCFHYDEQGVWQGGKK